MKKFSSQKILLIITVIVSVISSAVIAFVPLITNNENIGELLKKVIPLIFWIGVILEQFLLLLLRIINRKNIIKGMPGIISFFKNVYGKMADIVVIISLIVSFLLVTLNIGQAYIQYVLISMVILFFRLHAIFNGRVFRSLNKNQ